VVGKMFKNISKKIKNLAVLIFILSIVICGIWLLISAINWNENKEFYNSYVATDEFYNAAHDALTGLQTSAFLLIFGIISSFFIYGFGELIERVQRIDSRVEQFLNAYKSNNNDYE
jgi:amino acid transporter